MKKWISSLSLLAASPALYAQDASAPEQGSYWQTLIMVAIAILFFYFILWRPEQKRRKAMEQQRSQLKKGDKVTAMGIVGTVAKIQPDSPTMIVKMYDGSKIEMLKASISEVHPGTGSDDKDSGEEKPELTIDK